MKTITSKKDYESLLKKLHEKEHDLYLFEMAPESHIGEKKQIPSLKDEICMLTEEIRMLTEEIEEIRTNHLLK